MDHSLAIPRILIVEKRKSLLRWFNQWNKEWGIPHISSHTLAAVKQNDPAQPAELVVIDLDAAETAGMELLHECKQQDADLVVILVAAKINVQTSLAALRSGAFDLHLKSNHPDVLKQTIERGIEHAMRLKRQKELLVSLRENLDQLVQSTIYKNERSTSAGGEPDPSQKERVSAASARIIHFRNLIIHVRRNQIQSQHGVMDLTPTEFDLLLYLLSHKERIVECSELIRQLRGYDADEKEARILIRPHVCNLRNKLRTIQVNPDLIQNVRGMGYRLNQDGSR